VFWSEVHKDELAHCSSDAHSESQSDSYYTTPDSIRYEFKQSLVLEVRASNSDVQKYVEERIASENRLRRQVEKPPR
jgi:signal-transduction protein with cAMP-binding, CBS, and nucleotidyltransferase domain